MSTTTTTMKRVRFSNNLCHVCPEQPILYLEEKASMFYSEVDLKRFRRQARSARHNPAATAECWRGLEHKRTEVRATRKSHAQLVLAWQWANQQRVASGEPIQDFTATLDTKSVGRAMVTAIRDYVEAQHIHQETDNAASKPATAAVSGVYCCEPYQLAGPPKREIATAAARTA